MGGGGGAQKIMCAHAHHEREARCPLRPGSSTLKTPGSEIVWNVDKAIYCGHHISTNDRNGTLNSGPGNQST